MPVRHIIKTIYPAAELKGKRVFLRFQGVGSVADVYINKTYAGNHKGAYSAFAIEISKLLKYGESNEILVKVDNSPGLMLFRSIILYSECMGDLSSCRINRYRTGEYSCNGLCISGHLYQSEECES